MHLLLITLLIAILCKLTCILTYPINLTIACKLLYHYLYTFGVKASTANPLFLSDFLRSLLGALKKLLLLAYALESRSGELLNE
jgi:hypothetical protein